MYLSMKLNEILAHKKYINFFHLLNFIFCTTTSKCATINQTLCITLLEAELAVWQKPEEQSPKKCDEWSISLPMISLNIMAKPLPRCACSRAFDVGSDYQLGGVFFLPWAGWHWARHPLSQLQFLFTTHSHCCLCPLTRFRTVPGFVSSHFLSPNTWMEPLLHGEREREKQHAIWVGVWSLLKVLEYLTPFAKGFEAGCDWFNLSWSWNKLKCNPASLCLPCLDGQSFKPELHNDLQL